ncbi:unnamed protein product [Rotaria sordida]|uniref:Uncharacterized protein n=1 Tax=Rotaria sordida TaxID=392033 RepID=A0A819BL46_9BILA|nr:unnamed protein product [Rotaria sordida]
MSYSVIKTESDNINSITSCLDNYELQQRSLHKYTDDISDESPLHVTPTPNEFDVDHSNDNDIQEKQIEEELDIVQRTIRCGRLFCLSKFSFFRQSKEATESKTDRLKIYEIFSYADNLDILLMIAGIIAALISGGLYPVAMYFFQGITDNLANLGGSRIKFIYFNNVTNISNECAIVSNKNNQTELAYDSINRLTKYYIIIGFSNIICFWIAWATWMLAAERQVRRIRFALFRNILRQEIGWFDIQKAGELNNRLIVDLDKIKDGINYHVPQFFILLSITLSVVIFTLIIGYKLTFIFLSISPIIILIFNLTIIVIEKYTIKEVSAFATASSIAQEVLGNIRTVTSFHGQIKEEERFGKNLIETKNIGIRKGLYIGLCQCFSKIFNFVTFAITFWYGHQLTQTDCKNYSTGTVIVVLISCMVAIFSTLKFIPNFQNFAEALGSASYVFEMIDRESKIDAMSNEGDKSEHIIGDIEFENVTFTFPARPEIPALKNLSLKISSGKTIALVGPSGCGKSTIIQLIQRFYDPNQGRILIDGKDIKTLNVAWLRSHIGVVSQELALFTESIEDNIRLGKLDATDEEIQAAAKMANAHEFIMALPETLLGNKLSGGQKQRVAIARALISNPKILLLDEATSALDNKSERFVQDALDKVKAGRTTIIIAHRLSTIQNADFIIGLKHGQLVEHGTHHDLIRSKGLYYELIKVQNQRETDRNDDQTDDNIETNRIRQSISSRRYSKLYGSLTDNSYASDDDNNENIVDNVFRERKICFRIPFVFKILKFNTPEWSWILIGTICALTLGAVEPISAFLFSKIYGLIAEQDRDKQRYLINIYVGTIFILGFISGIAQLLSNAGFSISGEALTMRMRKLTFAAMIRQDMNYFDRKENSVGALVTRLSSDAAALKGMTGIRIGIIVQTISTTIMALTIAFISSWKLTFILLCFVPILALAGKFSGQQEADTGQSKSKTSFSEQGGQNATEAIENIRTVAALHQEQYFINLYENAFNHEFKQKKYRLHLVAIAAGIANSVMYFADGTMFWCGSKLVQNGETTFENVFRVYAVITFTMVQIGYSMALIPDYSKAKKAALRIMRLNRRQSQINPYDESGIILKEVKGNIEFQDVHFRYPTRPTIPVIINLSLKCVTGGITALVGPSGSGKSTVIVLLERFYEPSKGNILLDGHDIRLLNIRWLRSIIGFVQQEPVLFNISIYDNIAYGDNSREVTQDEIETAARMANIHEFICSLPKGYETLCGMKGNQLSGGQKQRIAIARALIRSPKILLLDEATSALDNESEKTVQVALDKEKFNRTCLNITHRLSTIQNSEKIAVVDRGNVKEEGTHDELLRLNGVYTKLIAAQRRST